MRRPALLFAALALTGAGADTRAPSEIVAAAPAGAWRDVAPADLIVMTIGDGRRVTIELAPAFSPAHVAAIRALVRAHAYDGTAVTRVQDDYVAQWGDSSPAHPLPASVPAHPPAEYDRPLAGLPFHAVPVRDAYADRVGFADGWPVASDGMRAWLPHCYAMVGIGRDMPPDTGDGRELYAVIGHAPRHLDRNIVLAGRVVDGIEALSALPRGTDALGVYHGAAERTPVRTMRIAADLPPAEHPAFQVMRTDDAAFAAYAQARMNRRDAFFVRPAGGADICNIPVPIRRRPA